MAFTVVVGYDGSAGARAALHVALGLAARLDGKIYIAYLFDAPLEPTIESLLREDGEHLTNGALMAAANRGVEAEVVIENHAIAEGLVRIAERRCADLLVVGTRGESALVGALLGSTCHRLVHCTTVPLLVVPPPEGAGGK